MSRIRWFAPLAVVLFLGSWETAARREWISPLFFPAPSTSLRALVRMVTDGDLLTDLWATLVRAGLGLCIGGLAGVGLGGAMAVSRRLNEALDPLIAATHPIPKVTLLPLAVLAFGVGEAPRVALVAISARSIQC